MVRSKELWPIFVDRSGQSRPEVAVWLLERASQVPREDPPDGAVPPIDGLDTAAVVADRIASSRLFERQADLADQNRARLEQERAKLVRYCEYRQRSASAKVVSTERTVERLQTSENPDEIRIMPVWVKNALAAERERRRASRDLEVLGLASSTRAIRWQLSSR